MGTLIKEYIFPFLQIVLIWPVVFLVFVLFFRKQIAKFIDEIAEFDWGGKKLTRKNNQESIKTIEDGAQKSSSSRWDYKRLFLDLFIKPNTIAALQWFYHNPGSHTAIDFSQKFLAPMNTGRSDGEEKDAIIGALRETDLIEVENGNYSISKEGEDYLRYKKLI